jgi:predicted nucleic acid-binding protein
MPSRLCYLDSSVLIDACRGEPGAAARARQVVDDPDRSFAASLFLKMEVLPKALWNHWEDDVEYYTEYFDAVSRWAPADDALAELALKELESCTGLGVMDALHVAAAAKSGAEEFITAERPSSPLHGVSCIRVVSIHP